MQIKQLLQRAMQIAAEAHEGQQDKVGNPYFDHCRRVAELVVGDEERIIAFLHDVPEKGSGWTLERASGALGSQNRIIFDWNIIVRLLLATAFAEQLAAWENAWIAISSPSPSSVW